MCVCVCATVFILISCSNLCVCPCINSGFNCIPSGSVECKIIRIYYSHAQRTWDFGTVLALSSYTLAIPI